MVYCQGFTEELIWLTCCLPCSIVIELRPAFESASGCLPGNGISLSKDASITARLSRSRTFRIRQERPRYALVSFTRIHLEVLHSASSNFGHGCNSSANYLSIRPKLAAFANQTRTPLLGLLSALIKDWVPLIDEYYYCAWLSPSVPISRSFDSSDTAP